MSSVESCNRFLSFVNSEETNEETKKELEKSIHFSVVSKVFKSSVLDCVDTEECLKICSRVNNVNLRSALLSDLSRKLSKDGNLCKARDVAHMVEQNYYKSRAFQKLSLRLAEEENFQSAIEETRNIHEEMCYGSTLEKISMKMFKKGLIEQSIELVKTIPYPGYKSSAIWCIRDEARKLKNTEIEEIVNSSAREILGGTGLLGLY